MPIRNRYEENIKTGVVDGQVIALGTDGIWEARYREGNLSCLKYKLMN